MTDSLIQANAKTKILEYKIDKIRTYILNKIDYVEPITKCEFKILLNKINEYELVPDNWELTNPLVEIPDIEH